jgi:outer membrane protein OmpA-like peptidoglycan-associated protein
MLRHLLACAIVAASLWSSSSAAQVSSSTIPLERFRAPSDVSGLGVTEGAGVVGHLAFQTGLIFNYALNPLVLRGADDSVVSAIVAHRLNADAQFTLGLFEYLSIGVDLPLTLLQLSGDVPADLKRAIGASSGLATIGVGDLRLTPKIRLLREDQHGVSLALIPAFTLPTSGGVRFNDGGASYAYGGDYLGEGAGAFAFIPELAVSTNIAGFRPALNLAYRLRQPTVLFNTFEIQPEFVYRLGLGYDVATIFDGLSSLLVFGELFGATADSNPFGLIDGSAASESVRIQNHLEALAGARYALPMGFSVEGGVGTGLRAGYGAPDLRVFAGVRWGIVDDDNDDDGIVDATDLCAAVPEDIDTFEDTDGCPDADNDNDGIPDGSDRCPLGAEDTDSFEDADGCLDPDNDTDGVLDVDDACRDVAGLARYKGCPPPDTDGDTFTDDVDVCPTVPGVTEKHGCPNDDKDNDGVEDVGDRCVDQAGPVALKGCPDRDGDTVADLDDACVDVAGVPALAGCKDTDADGIADSIDTCPEEPETINGIDDADGCPDKGKVLVVVTKDKIELKETVFFDSGKDTIQARSFSLLDQLALVMKAHPEVKKVRIEGHTDSDGADDKNLDLSKRRARAVLNALVTRGVEEGRLDSEGFGETKPIANNQTKAGKASNRRVELAIVEQ